MLEDFLELLRSWRGVISYDADDVAASHVAVAGFDLAGLGRLAQTLLAQSAATATALADLDAVAAQVPLTWSGAAGAELHTASARLAVDLAPTAEALAAHAGSAAAAHDVLAEVIDDYRATMTTVVAPIAATAPLAEVGEELSARLELAAAAGRAASAAVGAGIDALREEWRTSGELVLAGER